MSFDEQKRGANPTAAAAPLQVHYQNTVEDWRALQKSHGSRRRLWERLGPILLLEALVAACCLPATLLLLALGEFGALGIGWLLAGVLNAFFLLIAWNSSTPPDPKILRPTTIALRPEFLEVFSDHGWERRDWSLITAVFAADELIVLRRDDALVYAVPRRAFASPEAAEQFLAAAERYRRAAEDRPQVDAPASWQTNPPAEAIANGAMQVRFLATAHELAELHTGVVLRPVDASEQPAPKSAGIFSWLLLVCVALAIFASASVSGNRLSATFTSFFMFLLLSVLTVFPVLRLVQFFATRRVRRAPAVTQTVAISPQGVALWAPRLETQNAWESIDAVLENDRVVVFSANRPTAVSVYVVPKSAFPDEHAARRFAESASRFRQTAADRLEEETLLNAPRQETGNPYQPPQAQ